MWHLSSASSSTCLSTLRVSSVPGLHVSLQNGKAHEMCACVGTHSHVRERVHDTVDFSNPKELELSKKTHANTHAHTLLNMNAYLPTPTAGRARRLEPCECVHDSDR